MNKNRIILTESQLHNIIKESVQQILSEMEMSEEIENEGWGRNLINGVRDMYHNITDNTQQLSNYYQGRNYDDAVNAQKNGQQLSRRQQMALNKGNDKLQQMQNATQRRLNNKRQEYINGGSNTHGYSPTEKTYNAIQGYRDANQRNSRMKNIKNPYSGSNHNL